MPRSSKRHVNGRPAAAAGAPGVVDPVWLLKAFLAAVLVAVACGYLTLCGLFYRGQWQLVLHPSRTAAAPEAVGGVPFQTVRFAAGATGVPQLTGWWIPAGQGAAFAHLTILYLPGGDGSLAGDQGTLARLHDVGLSVFALDYRGFGQSAELHPSERSMADDAEAAWDYLTRSRALGSDRIIPYGRGLGVALALRLAATHASVPALILDQPEFDVEGRVRRDSRSRLVPVGLLLRNRFALRPALDELKLPKLILSRGEVEDPEVLRAADPKMTVVLPPSAMVRYAPVLKRFLDLYAPPTQVPAVMPRPAPRPQ